MQTIFGSGDEEEESVGVSDGRSTATVYISKTRSRIRAALAIAIAKPAFSLRSFLTCQWCLPDFFCLSCDAIPSIIGALHF